MLLDSKQYDQQLNKSVDQLKQFGKQNLTVNGVLAQGVGALGKMAAGFGVAKVAGMAFNGALENSQTLADAFGSGSSIGGFRQHTAAGEEGIGGEVEDSHDHRARQAQQASADIDGIFHDGCLLDRQFLF